MAVGHHHRKTQKESQITPKRSSFNSKHESAFKFFVLFFFSYEFCFWVVDFCNLFSVCVFWWLWIKNGFWWFVEIEWWKWLFLFSIPQPLLLLFCSCFFFGPHFPFQFNVYL
jgi:hypothetical protein